MNRVIRVILWCVFVVTLCWISHRVGYNRGEFHEWDRIQRSRLIHKQ